MSSLWPMFFSTPLSVINWAILLAVNFPAAQAVSTDSPSLSMTASHEGTLLFSTSPRTMKYESEKLVVIRSGEFSFASPTL